MPTFRNKAHTLAAEYRDFWAENAGLGLALGFVPVVGQVLGIADAVATHNDERATALDKTLATAGVLPLGKGLAAAKGLLRGRGAGGPIMSVVGPTTIQRAKDQGVEDLLTTPHYDPDFGTEVAELVDYGRVPQRVIDVTNNGRPRTGPLRALVPDEPLLQIVDEAGDIPTTVTNVRRNAAGQLEPARAGEGAYQWRSPVEPRGGNLEIGTATKMNRLENADYDEIEGAYVHERSHITQAEEVAKEIWDRKMSGTNVPASGHVGYFFNLGELDAEADRLRRKWPAELRNEMKPHRFRAGMKKLMEENIAAGRVPTHGMENMADPAVARRYAEWAAEEPINQNLSRMVERGRPNWASQAKAGPGAWATTMKVEDVFNLDPRLGEKMKKIGESGNFSARYTGPDTNHARLMAMGETIEPVRAKVVWDDAAGALAVEDLDGLRRALAARNMFGRGQKIPVVFEPADDVARTMAADPAVRKGIGPLESLYRDDDARYHKYAKTAEKLVY